MRLVTLGSRVLDDSIRIIEDSGHNNAMRLVGISPFSLYSDIKIDSFDEEKIIESNEYRKNIFRLDITKDMKGKMDKLKYDLFCVDFLDAKRKVWECTFEDNRVFRCTNSEALINNIDLIKTMLEETAGCKIAREEVLDPVEWDDDRLNTEIVLFCEALRALGKLKKMVLLQAHLPFQYISGADIVNAQGYNEIAKLNRFFDRCNAFFADEMDCVKVPLVKYVLGGSKYKNFDRMYYTEEYYDFINTFLHIAGKKIPEDKLQELVDSYKLFMQDRVSQMLLNKENAVRNLTARIRGRKVVLVGALQGYEDAFKEATGMEVALVIRPEEIFAGKGLNKKLTSIANKASEYVMVLPFVNRDNNLLYHLWKIGYYLNSSVVIPDVDFINLKDLDGEYYDIFDNYVSCKSKNIAINIGGMGISVTVDESQRNPYKISLLARTQSVVKLGRNIAADKLTIGIVEGGYCEINDDCTFADNCFIVNNIMTRIYIGKDCMFSSKIVVHAGDGHGIFDLKSEQRCNQLPENIDTSDYEIRLGEHVWVGYQVFLLPGTNVDTGCIIGARSVVNKQFPNNCILAGSAAKLVKKDITWARDPFTPNIYDNRELLSEEYMQMTREIQ